MVLSEQELDWLQLAIEDNSISAMELTPYADNQVDGNHRGQALRFCR